MHSGSAAFSISCSQASYKSVHLLSCQRSLIRVSNSIQGAVHATKCVHSELHFQCHQLRLHESYDLRCFVRVSTGAILEDCRRIVFFTKPSDELDVKDFNFLKQGVPSPNFQIEMVEIAGPPQSEKDTLKEHSSEASTVAAAPSTPPVTVSIDHDDEDDDEL